MQPQGHQPQQQQGFQQGFQQGYPQQQQQQQAYPQGQPQQSMVPNRHTSSSSSSSTRAEELPTENPTTTKTAPSPRKTAPVKRGVVLPKGWTANGAGYTSPTENDFAELPPTLLALAEGLPAGWEVDYNEEGDAFYINPKGESEWDRPAA